MARKGEKYKVRTIPNGGSPGPGLKDYMYIGNKSAAKIGSIVNSMYDSKGIEKTQVITENGKHKWAYNSQLEPINKPKAGNYYCYVCGKEHSKDSVIGRKHINNSSRSNINWNRFGGGPHILTHNPSQRWHGERKEDLEALLESG